MRSHGIRQSHVQIDHGFRFSIDRLYDMTRLMQRVEKFGGASSDVDIPTTQVIGNCNHSERTATSLRSARNSAAAITRHTSAAVSATSGSHRDR